MSRSQTYGRSRSSGRKIATATATGRAATAHCVRHPAATRCGIENRAGGVLTWVYVLRCTVHLLLCHRMIGVRHTKQIVAPAHRKTMPSNTLDRWHSRLKRRRLQNRFLHRERWRRRRRWRSKKRVGYHTIGDPMTIARKFHALSSLKCVAKEGILLLLLLGGHGPLVARRHRFASNIQ
jgi:hypothetical protein